MTQRTYYDDATPAWQWWSRAEVEPSHRSLPLRHGLTLADLDHAARLAISRNIGWSAWTPGERYEIALSAASLALCEATEAPAFGDVVEAGVRALARAFNADLHHRGIDKAADDRRPAPKFASYWWFLTGPTGSHEPAVVERVALAQVWPALSERDRQALLALAFHASRAQAAHALGVPTSTFNRWVVDARRRAFALWHDGETPPEPPREHAARATAATCGRGHPWTPETTRYYATRGRPGARPRRYCYTCAQLRWQNKKAAAA